MNTETQSRLLRLFVSQIQSIELWDEGDYIVIMHGQTNQTGFIVGRTEAEQLKNLQATSSLANALTNLPENKLQEVFPTNGLVPIWTQTTGHRIAHKIHRKRTVELTGGMVADEIVRGYCDAIAQSQSATEGRQS